MMNFRAMKKVAKQHLATTATPLGGAGLIGLAVYWLSMGQYDWALGALSAGLGAFGIHLAIGTPSGDEPTIPITPSKPSPTGTVSTPPPVQSSNKLMIEQKNKK